MRAVLLCLSLLACAREVNASTQWGLVTWVSIRQADGLVFFGLNSTFVHPPRTAGPPCATQGYWVLGNISNPVVRAQYELLVQASAAGKSVRVDGTHACTVWPDAEDATTLWIT